MAVLIWLFGDLRVNRQIKNRQIFVQFTLPIRYAYKSPNIKFSNSAFWLFRQNLTTSKFPVIRYVINPEQLHQFPPSHSSSLQVVSVCELVRISLWQKSEIVVLWVMKARDDTQFHTQCKVSDLISFDPLLALSSRGLNVLYNKTDQEISSDALQSIADDLSEYWKLICTLMEVSKQLQRSLITQNSDPFSADSKSDGGMQWYIYLCA